MKKRTIAPEQLDGLVFLSLLTLGTETLPSLLAVAGSAAWLCPLAAGGVVWLAGRMVRHPFAGRVVLSGSSHHVGSRILGAILLLWGLFAAAAQAERVGRRLSEDLRGSALLLSAAAVLLAAWMASGGLPALSRAGQIFTMAIGLACSVIVLFGLPGMRWDWIVLWTGEELRNVPAGVLEVWGELSVGLYALLFLEDLEPKGRRERKGWGKPALLFLLLSLGELLVLGRLGPGLIGEVGRPFLQMVSGLGFRGAFQRLEELASALWLLGDLTLLALLLLSQRRLLAGAMKREEVKTLVWLPSVAVLAAVLLRLPESVCQGGAALRGGSLAAGALLALLAMTSKKSEKNRKGG